MLTQPAVKTSLAWSTVRADGLHGAAMRAGAVPAGAAAYRGAFALQGACLPGLRRRGARRSPRSAGPGPVAVPDLARRGARLRAGAGDLRRSSGSPSGSATKPPQAVALGAILIFGVAYLIAQGLADAAPRALAWRTVALSVAATLAYFALQHAATWALGGHPAAAAAARRPLIWALIVLAVASFGRRGGGADDLPALGRPSGRGGAARPSDERPLSQRGLRAAGRPLDLDTRSRTNEGAHAPGPARPLQLFAAADEALRQIPPAFPLEATVAVNPWLGQAGEDRHRRGRAHGPRRRRAGCSCRARRLPR